MIFPDTQAVETAARAIYDVLRGTPHVYNKSLRYLPTDARLEIARRAARKALCSLYLSADQDHAIDALADQVAERLKTGMPAASCAAERCHRPKYGPWRRPEYGQIETHARLKAKYDKS
jgi:hypothetical protein